MFLTSVLSLVLTAAEPNSAWHVSYEKATDLAIKEKKDLLIYFRGRGELDEVLHNADVVKKFLAEKPTALGLAVPGMPMGSPGMESAP